MLCEVWAFYGLQPFTLACYAALVSERYYHSSFTLKSGRGALDRPLALLATQPNVRRRKRSRIRRFLMNPRGALRAPSGDLDPIYDITCGSHAGILFLRSRSHATPTLILYVCNPIFIGGAAVPVYPRQKQTDIFASVSQH